MKDIIQAIQAERERQRGEHTPQSDARHSGNDWIAICCRHLGLAAGDAAEVDPERWRKQMIRLAAVCVAALESQEWKRVEFERQARKPVALIEMLQREADKAGEVMLLILEADPHRPDGTHNMPYGVFESRANAWELSHIYQKITPGEKG